MEVGRDGQGDLGTPVAAGTLLEGQGYRHIGPLEQPLAIGQEAIDQPPEAGGRGVKGGADGIGGHLLQLAGDNGGEQGMRQICCFSLGEISVLPMVLIFGLHSSLRPSMASASGRPPETALV